MEPTPPFKPPIHGPRSQVGTFVRRVVWLSAAGLLTVLAGMLLAACIVEGCTIAPVKHVAQTITFALDAGHPVATTQVTVSLSASALPTSLVDTPPRLKVTVAQPAAISLMLIDGSTQLTSPMVTSGGIADLALERCTPGQACELQFLAIVEWLKPGAAGSISADVTFDVGVAVPREQGQCGLPYDAIVEVAATPPEARSTIVQAGLEPRVGSAKETVQHVTITAAGGLASRTPGAPGDGVAARGHLGIATSASPKPGTPARGIPGMWLRVTPDDTSVPIVDGSVTGAYVTLPGYPTLPAAADFPILDDCQSGGPCARGYWIQILVFDPTGRSLDDAAFDPFTWSVDASVSYPEGAQPPTDGLSVVADTGPAGIATPPSLVLRGPGGTFHVDDAHVVTSLTIDAHLEPRATAPVFGDGRAGVTIIFNLRSYATPGSSAGAPDSYLWLSNGHYVGDGSTGDDQADTGGWGGPGRMAYPPGRPLAACAGVVTACTSQTGLVVHRYTDSFAHGDQVTTFEVAWDWVVIGAPPDASVEVVAQDGETPLAGTNEIPGSTSRGVLVLVALALVMVAAVVGNALINRRKRLRRP